MRILSRIISAYDKKVVKSQGWKVVPGSTLGFLYLVPLKHKGKPVRIEDGTVINKGDLYYQIHIMNDNLVNLDTSHESLFTMMNAELKLVGEHMKKEENADYKAVLAVTLLHKLVRKVGFTVNEIENPIERKLVSLGENILRTALRKEKDNGPKKKRVAKKCWISRDQIMKIK